MSYEDAEKRTTSDPDSGGISDSELDDGDGVFSAAFKAQLRELLRSRDEVAELDAKLKAAKAHLNEVELDVFERFEGYGDGDKIQGTIPVPLGGEYGTVKFKTRETHFAKIVDDEKLQEYLEQRGIVDEMVQPKFAKARLNEMVREIIDDPDGKMIPGLSYYTNRGMTITRQK